MSIVLVKNHTFLHPNTVTNNSNTFSEFDCTGPPFFPFHSVLHISIKVPHLILLYFQSVSNFYHIFVLNNNFLILMPSTILRKYVISKNEYYGKRTYHITNYSMNMILNISMVIAIMSNYH